MPELNQSDCSTTGTRPHPFLGLDQTRSSRPSPWLRGGAHLFRTAGALRNCLYDRGILTVHRVSCRVISFGNVAVGGTGKTPLVIYAARLLSSMGLRGVVLSRGYGGTAGKKGAVVGHAGQCFLGPAMAGDEPFMMASSLEWPVVVDRDRVRGARRAVQWFDPHVILLDDGFQHRRLHRDLDMVLMDAAAPLGNGCHLPAGRLREGPESVLRRADAVIYTRCSAQRPAQQNWERGKPVFYTRHHPCLARWVVGGECLEGTGLEELAGKRAGLLSAIADNEGFRHAVETLGVKVVHHLARPDHHRFSRYEILGLFRHLKNAGTDLVITTQKDDARMGYPMTWPVSLAVLGVDMVFDSPDQKQVFTRLIWPGKNVTLTNGHGPPLFLFGSAHNKA